MLRQKHNIRRQSFLKKLHIDSFIYLFIYLFNYTSSYLSQTLTHGMNIDRFNVSYVAMFRNNIGKYDILRCHGCTDCWMSNGFLPIMIVELLLLRINIIILSNSAKNGSILSVIK